MQGKELQASRHLSPSELSALHALLSPSGQAAVRNAQRHALTFFASAGTSDPVEWGGAGPGVLAPVDRAAQMISVVPGMVPAEDEAAFAEMVGGTAAAEAAFVTIPRTLLRQLLASLEDLDLRSDRAERGTLRTIRASLEARLTIKPKTADDLRTLVAAVVQDVTDASEVIQDEARELDRIGLALMMALEALRDVEMGRVS